MWDKDFDKHVERTKNRPLASGELSLLQASAALMTTLSCSLGVLVSMNYDSVLLGLASMPLVISYPLMKRYTNFPQFVLGLAFNWGVLVGWTEVTGTFSLLYTLPLYIGGVCWTLVYDTIYGYQDASDDKKLGLKSTSLYFGENPTISLTLCASGMMAGVTFAGYNVGLTYPFYVGMVGCVLHLAWQITTINIKDKTNLWNRFHSNQYLGMLVTASIVAGHF